MDALIREAQATGDLSDLRKQSIKGFGTNESRRAAWRLVLGIQRSYNPTVVSRSDHRDYEQVMADVNRSFLFVASDEFRQRKREQLEKVIMTVLVRNPGFHYYQGLHDVVSIVLTFAREPFAVLVMEALAERHLSPFFEEKFDGVPSIVNFVFPVLARVDPDVAVFMERLEIDPMAFLPYILTYFVHGASVEHALRFLDLLVCCHPLMPVYVIAIAVSMKRDVVMAPRADEGSVMAVANTLMDNLDIDTVIDHACSAFAQFPPSVVLSGDPEIALSRKCRTLSPDIEYQFPVKDKFDRKVYENHIRESRHPSLFQRILSVLAAAFGRR